MDPMEVKETAACGISEREFAIEFEPDEISEIYRIFRYVHSSDGFYNEDFLEDLKSQMSYIIGPSLEEEPPEEAPAKEISWEDTGVSYNLNFIETQGRKLYQILNAVEHPGEGFDTELNQKIMEQMVEMVPTALEGLPLINR